MQHLTANLQKVQCSSKETRDILSSQVSALSNMFTLTWFDSSRDEDEQQVKLSYNQLESAQTGADCFKCAADEHELWPVTYCMCVVVTVCLLYRWMRVTRLWKDWSMNCVKWKTDSQWRRRWMRRTRQRCISWWMTSNRPRLKYVSFRLLSFSKSKYVHCYSRIWSRVQLTLSISYYPADLEHVSA